MAEESIAAFVADYVLRDQVQEYFEHHWSKDYIYPTISTIVSMAIINTAADLAMGVVGMVTGEET